MKKTFVPVLALLLTLCVLLGGCSGSPAKTVSFTLMGDSVHGESGHTTYEVWIDASSVELKEGDSAEAVIYRALEKAGYKTEGEGYISGITTPEGLTLGDGSNGGSCGWIFSLNGVIPSVSMAESFPVAGDSIALRFVDDYNTEIDWSTNTFID